MIVFIFFTTVLCFSTAQLIVTPSGTLSGSSGTSRNGRPYDAYTKIPYAQPPLGELRFQNPKEYGKWEGVYRAVEDSPTCLQVDGLGSDIPTSVMGTEDCLYLNVYRPKVNNNALPVLVFVHGGAFSTGHPGQKESASYMMDEDVILVTITYRLGALGFMSLEDDVMPGNYGSKDQAMAIKWVKNNIASFGGNPESITVFGESAGGASAHLLAISPLTKDIVTSIAMISGTGYLVRKYTNYPGTSKNETLKCAALLGCNFETSEEIVRCLRNMNTSDLINIVTMDGDVPFVPVVEPEGQDAFMPFNPLEQDTFLPMIMSYSTGERILATSSLYGDPAALDYTMKNLYDYIHYQCSFSFGINEKFFDRIKTRYFTGIEEMDDLTQLGLVREDPGFVYPVFDIAANHRGPKWIQHFEYRGEYSLIPVSPTTVAHADDRIYWFNSSQVSPLNEKDTQVSKTYVKLLANFATFGNPTPQDVTSSLLMWPEHKSNEMLRITNDGLVMAEPSFYRLNEDIYGFWKSIECMNKNIKN